MQDGPGHPTGPAARMSPQRFRGALVALAAVSVVSHASALGNGFINWDDGLYLAAAARPDPSWMLRESFEANYHPLTLATLTLEHRLFGDDPFFYHLDNVLLHSANAVLAALLVSRLAPGAPLVALACGLLFAVHPLHVESIAWVSERKGLLSACFALLSLLAWVSYTTRPRWQPWAASLLLAGAALLSKPIAVSLPVVLVLLDLRLGRGLDVRALLDKLPFFALALVVGLVNLQAQPAPDPTKFAIDAAGLGERIALATQALAFYTSRVFWPVGLSAFYDVALARVSPLQWGIALSAGAAAVGLALWRWEHRGNALFGLLFFTVTLAPALKVVPFGFDSIWNDRYVYVPSIGLLLVFTLPLARLPRWPARAATAGLLAVTFTFAVASWKRCEVWRDSERFWTDVLRHYPDTPRAHEKLGAYYLHELGDPERALPALHAALELRPDWSAHLNLGHLHAAQGDEARAVAHLERAAELRPDDARVRTTVATWYVSNGDLPRAAEHLQELVELRPGSALGHHNLGMVAMRQNQMGRARSAFRRAVEIEPRMAESWVGLGRIALMERDRRRALEHLERAEALGGTVDPALIRELRREPAR